MCPSGQKCEHHDIGCISPTMRNIGNMSPGMTAANVSDPEKTRFSLENVDNGSRKRKSGNPIADEKMIPQNRYAEIFFLNMCFFLF